MTGERIGIGHDPSRGAAYVESWVAVLQKDPREIRRAAGEAQKISDYLLVRSRERAAERELTATKSVVSRIPSVAAEPQREPTLPLADRGSSPSRG